MIQLPGRMERGLFVSFEGSEGCGKSTQIQLLEQQLKAGKRSFLVTREPGGTPLGESIRHLLKFAPEGEGMCAESELLLFTASRAQLVREVIKPSLAEGTHVIADRFLDSTVVYQGLARGLDLEAVHRINQLAVGGCLPDLTVILDMDSGTAWERATAASKVEGGPDRMEKEPPAFYEIVRQGYLNLASEEPDRFVVVNAARSKEVVAEEIWAKFESKVDGLSR